MPIVTKPHIVNFPCFSGEMLYENIILKNKLTSLTQHASSPLWSSRGQTSRSKTCNRSFLCPCFIGFPYNFQVWPSVNFVIFCITCILLSVCKRQWIFLFSLSGSAKWVFHDPKQDVQETSRYSWWNNTALIVTFDLQDGRNGCFFLTPLHMHVVHPLSSHLCSLCKNTSIKDKSSRW